MSGKFLEELTNYKEEPLGFILHKTWQLCMEEVPSTDENREKKRVFEIYTQLCDVEHFRGLEI